MASGGPSSRHKAIFIVWTTGFIFCFIVSNMITNITRRLWLSLFLVACCLAEPAAVRPDAEGPRAAPGPRRLVLVLDGVPYRTVTALRAEGRFRAFRDPARMISTFPSLTNPAMIEILGAEDSPGYEDHYFDRERNRMVGGIPDRMRGDKFVRGTFRESFDYHGPAFVGSLAYVGAPLGAMIVAEADLAGFKRAFHAARAPVFVGYIGETDSLAHLGGEWALKSFLRRLDRTVEELIKESGGELEVEMFSDHGNRFGWHRRVDLGGAITRAGLVTAKKLGAPRAVVMPQYGLVGSAVLFTAEENRAPLAEACARVEGVDFAAYPVDGAVEVVSRHGRARISRSGERYRYEAVSGDPLALNPAVERLHAAGALDEAGFAGAADWLKAAGDHHYADPLRRIFDSFHAHVRSRADVIVSLEDGYLTGNPVMGLFVWMRATHGNLRRGETEGFAMSTRQELGAAVRGHELRRLFKLDAAEEAESFFGRSGHCRTGPALARALTVTGAP